MSILLFTNNWTLTFDLLIKNRSITRKLKCELLTVQDHILSTNNIRIGESFASIFFCIDKDFLFISLFYFIFFFIRNLSLKKKYKSHVVTSTALSNIFC